MKTFVKTIVIALFSVVSFFANATDTNKTTNAKKTFAVAVYQTENTMKIKIVVEKLAGEKLSVILKSKSGYVLYSEYISKKKTIYCGKFDLKDLEDGKYFFEISDGVSKIVKNVEVGTIKPETITGERFMSMN